MDSIETPSEDVNIKDNSKLTEEETSEVGTVSSAIDRNVTIYY